MISGLRDIIISSSIAFILTPLALLGLQISSAQVMQSTNYRIESDSVNFGGGLSSSTNYALESTGGEIATGESSSATYALKAGYQQMVTRFISLSSPASVTMSPSIVGITGGESNGSTQVTVITDSSAGYELSINADVAPAMVKGSDSISDYGVVGDPDYTFTTDTEDSHFGYSPSGSDVVTRFKDDGVSACNTGSFETALTCWDGLSTSAETIARRTSANTPNGSTTTVHFKVGIGSGVVQPAGIYTATTTLTAVSL
jgi:hypothetical protein